MKPIGLSSNTPQQYKKEARREHSSALLQYKPQDFYRAVIVHKNRNNCSNQYPKTMVIMSSFRTDENSVLSKIICTALYLTISVTG